MEFQVVEELHHNFVLLRNSVTAVRYPKLSPRMLKHGLMQFCDVIKKLLHISELNLLLGRKISRPADTCNIQSAVACHFDLFQAWWILIG